MGKSLVTGASGHLGSLVIKHPVLRVAVKMPMRRKRETDTIADTHDIFHFALKKEGEGLPPRLGYT